MKEVCINDMICIIEYSTNYIVILIFDILKDERNVKIQEWKQGSCCQEMGFLGLGLGIFNKF